MISLYFCLGKQLSINYTVHKLPITLWTLHLYSFYICPLSGQQAWLKYHFIKVIQYWHAGVGLGINLAYCFNIQWSWLIISDGKIFVLNDSKQNLIYRCWDTIKVPAKSYECKCSIRCKVYSLKATKKQKDKKLELSIRKALQITLMADKVFILNDESWQTKSLSPVIIHCVSTLVLVQCLGF